ncbi:MAG: type VI secretion system baseplate subunit TssG [Pseudomonadota bacterium]
MQTTHWQPEPSVIQRLIDEPQRFQFFHAVRTLVIFARKNGIAHDELFARLLRFQNTLRLEFPASQIEALTAHGACEVRTDTMLHIALREHPNSKIKLTSAFAGLLGTSGTLPFHYSETIASRLPRGQAAAIRAFMDLISNRLIGLFYQALGKYRLEHKLDSQGEDGLLPILLALAGMSGAGVPAFFRQHGRAAISDHVAAYYAALIRTRPVSAHAIERVLSDYFAVPVVVEEFVGSWDDIPENRICVIPGPNARLGYGATLGKRLWRFDRRIRLHIGPLEAANLERLLPHGDGAKAIEAMLALFGVGDMDFEARLILSPACIEPLRLTNDAAASRRLGWTSFLTTRPGKAQTPEVRYMLCPP